MTDSRVLFIESVHPILDQRLSEAGLVCEHRYDDSREILMKDAAQYVGIVLRSRVRMDRDFLDAATSLRFIARSGSGLENIDLDYCALKGIHVFSSPEGNRDAVGEHALGMLLMLFNRLHLADREVRSGVWNREKNRGIELAGKTVGLIGYGQMGSAFARKLSGMDCRIIAYDKYLSLFPDSFAEKVSLEILFREADIVSLHLPQTPETLCFADETFFRKFQKPVFFINTSRGKQLRTAALVQALNDGCVLGACLDVLEYEKDSLEGLSADKWPSDLAELIGSERVVFSPHVAGWTQESYYKLSSVLADKIIHWKESERP